MGLRYMHDSRRDAKRMPNRSKQYYTALIPPYEFVPWNLYCCFCTSYCVCSFKNPLLSLQIFHVRKIYPTNAYTKI